MQEGGGEKGGGEGLRGLATTGNDKLNTESIEAIDPDTNRRVAENNDGAVS